jgi:hypothetical protein
VINKNNDPFFSPLDPIQKYRFTKYTLFGIAITILLMTVFAFGIEFSKFAVKRYKYLTKLEAGQNKIGYRLPNIKMIYPCVERNDRSSPVISLCAADESGEMQCSICIPVEDLAIFVKINHRGKQDI